jgi:hypothetical protein
MIGDSAYDSDPLDHQLQERRHPFDRSAQAQSPPGKYAGRSGTERLIQPLARS